MKQLYIALIIFYANFAFNMEAPPSITAIVGKRTGEIDVNTETVAQFLEQGKAQAIIKYTLQGGAAPMPAVLAGHNSWFLANITYLDHLTPNTNSYPLHALLAFAIHNLKELHKKQDTEGAEDKNLYIKAHLNPQNPKSALYELFGFKKVGDTYSGENIYLLDPSTQVCVPPVSSIKIVNSIQGKWERAKTLGAFSIAGQRTGNIDQSYKTTAQLLENGTPKAKIGYTLQGEQAPTQASIYLGPAPHINKCFLARITNLEYLTPEDNPLYLSALLTFAVNNLKELHSKQKKENHPDKKLYIDTVVPPQDTVLTDIYESFKFKKVDSGAIGDIYLLEPSDKILKKTLLPSSVIKIEEKSVEEFTTSSEEENNPYKKLLAEITARNHAAAIPSLEPELVATEQIQKLLDEQGMRTHSVTPKRLAPEGIAVTPSSDLPAPIPAAATAAHAAFPRLIRTAPTLEPKIRKSPRIATRKKS